MLSPQTIAQYIEKYRNKATVVREIHSNIAESKRKWDIGHTLATIVLGAVFTFTGFMGTDKIFDVLFAKNAIVEKLKDVSVKNEAIVSAPSKDSSATARITAQNSSLAAAQQKSSVTQEENGRKDSADQQALVSRKGFDLSFNVAALALFIVSILNLIYRWKDEHTVHFQGVVKLTAYLNWLDELKLFNVLPSDTHTIKTIRSRYQSIVESLPPNDEKDYRRAKGSLMKKQKVGNSRSRGSALTSANSLKGADFVARVLNESLLLTTVLKALREVNGDLWLGGGAVRNLVWDKLTGRSTVQDDFDVPYFFSGNLDPAKDKEIERDILSKLGMGLKISVKNQARMHLVNGEPATSSIESSIAQWPETATAVAVRLNERDELEFVAPYGFDDLLKLVVRPTPYHQAHNTSYNARKTTKSWKTHWPELDVK